MDLGLSKKKTGDAPQMVFLHIGGKKHLLNPWDWFWRRAHSLNKSIMPLFLGKNATNPSFVHFVPTKNVKKTHDPSHFATASYWHIPIGASNLTSHHQAAHPHRQFRTPGIHRDPRGKQRSVPGHPTTNSLRRSSCAVPSPEPRAVLPGW